jgi:hypothetical protein
MIDAHDRSANFFALSLPEKETTLIRPVEQCTGSLGEYYLYKRKERALFRLRRICTYPFSMWPPVFPAKVEPAALFTLWIADCGMQIENQRVVLFDHSTIFIQQSSFNYGDLLRPSIPFCVHRERKAPSS